MQRRAAVAALLAGAAVIVLIILISGGDNGDDGSPARGPQATEENGDARSERGGGSERNGDRAGQAGERGPRSERRRARERREARRIRRRTGRARQRPARRGSPTGGAPSGTEPSEERRRDPTVATIDVAGGGPVGGVQRIDFPKNERVRLIVRSDSDEVVEIPGYDLTRRVSAGGSARFYFETKKEGLFEIELRNGRTRIGVLSIN
jgi:hypothetical protein